LIFQESLGFRENFIIQIYQTETSR
jgi:hypothetical protein